MHMITASEFIAGIYLNVRAGDVASAYRPASAAELRALPACPTLLLYLSLSVLEGFFFFLCSQGEREMSDGVQTWLPSLFLFSHRS